MLIPRAMRARYYFPSRQIFYPSRKKLRYKRKGQRKEKSKTYFMKVGKSSQMASHPAHLHTPCPYK